MKSNELTRIDLLFNAELTRKQPIGGQHSKSPIVKAFFAHLHLVMLLCPCYFSILPDFTASNQVPPGFLPILLDFSFLNSTDFLFNCLLARRTYVKPKGVLIFSSAR